MEEKEPVFAYEKVTFPAELATESMEQGIECDGILPDYLPDISRVLRCALEPRILGRQWLGDSLTIDGETVVSMLYFSEEGEALSVYENVLPFSKTVDCALNTPEIQIELLPRVDYCHCRVVNKRRAEIRGAVTIRMRITGGQEETLLSEVDGCGLQCHRKSVSATLLQAAVEEQFEERGDFPLTEGEAGLTCILDRRAVFELTEQRILDGKLLLKGSCKIFLLAQRGNGDLCRLSKEIPVSKVLESEALTEEAKCLVGGEVLRLDVTLPEEDAEEELLICIAELRLTAKQVRTQPVMLIDDAFSTLYQTELEKGSLQIPLLSEMIEESGNATDIIKLAEEQPVEINGVFCTLDRVSITPKFGELLLQGNLIYTVYYSRAEGTKAVLERTLPFEIVRKLTGDSDSFRFEGGLQVTEVRCGEPTAEGLEVTARLSLRGMVFSVTAAAPVVGLRVLTDAQKEHLRKGNLVIYFGEKGEELWNIGKKYNLSVERLMEENHLEEEQLKEKTLLLIPTAASSVILGGEIQ